MDKNVMASPNNLLCEDILAYIAKRKRPASDKARITAAQLSQSRPNTKRGAKDILESTAKKSERKPNDTDADLDVTAQTGLHAVEIFVAKVEAIAKVHTTVMDHVPEPLWHHTFTNPTSDIREALGVPEPTKISRVHYILVFHKLQPITELHGMELLDVWRRCILCHFTLWKEGVYHRDASPGNMMWYWKDGKRIGTLNDYDLSSLADDLGARGNERTGTVPFMALDLLAEADQQAKVKHLYRYDLESFIWGFIWICLRYRCGVLLPTKSRPLDEWATMNAVACGKEKRYFLSHLRFYYPRDINQHMGHFLVDCVTVLRQYFERQTAHFDQLLEQEETEQSDDEEPEDIDGFLRMFTTMPSWVELSNPSQ